ncbi:MAG: hypothetical protein ACR2OH_04520 [Microthrixaceae bacterium]
MNMHEHRKATMRQSNHPRGFRALVGVGLVAVAAVLLLSACSPKYSSERDGKALGQALCDLKEADSSDDRRSALDDINSELDNLESEYAFYTADDRETFESALDQFESDAEAGDLQAMQQDLAALDSGAQNIASNAGEVTQAAWDGLRQGLSTCIG